MANSNFDSKRVRHNDVKHHFVFDVGDAREISIIYYVDTGKQHAGALTGAIFEKCSCERDT